MHIVYEVLAEAGLKDLGDLEASESWPEDKLRRLHERLYSTVFEEQTSLSRRGDQDGILDPFRFVASASMRGDAGCSEPICRYKKLEFLGRFTALYATSIVVPLNLPNPALEHEISYLRPRVQQALFTLLSSRVLVNAGRFIPMVMRTSHCEHEMVHVAEMREIIGSFMDFATEEFAKDFTVSYQRPEDSPSGLPSIYIDGPEEFLEHGSIVYRELDGKTPKLSIRRKFDAEGKLAIRGKQKLPFLSPIFEEIGQNSSFYLAYRMRHDARLLTDRAGEAMFLREINEDSDFVASTDGMQALSHALPLISDLPIETLLRIRGEERESFEAYRLSITEVTNNALSKGLSLSEASNFVASELRPRLEKITREVALERSKQQRRVGFGVASLAAGVALGAFGGLPLLASVPIAALGTGVGGRLISKAVESYCEHGADLRQKNDLFFLLRLLEEGEG